MKSNTHAFPYPVLTPAEGATDYKDSAFQCSLSFELNEDLTLSIDYQFILSNEEINKLIENDQASFAIEISCTDTLKREFHSLGSKGKLLVNASELYRRVEFTPMVIVKGNDVPFASSDMNDEFDNASFVLNCGDMIAIDETWVKYIEFHNLPFSSLVRVKTDDSLDPLLYQIEPAPSFIWIRMGTDMRDLWQKMQEDKSLKPTLAMSIYKDVIFCAVDDLIHNEDSESYCWVEPLKTHIASLGCSIPEEYDFNNINSFAQKLVQGMGADKLLKFIGE